MLPWLFRLCDWLDDGRRPEDCAGALGVDEDEIAEAIRYVLTSGFLSRWEAAPESFIENEKTSVELDVAEDELAGFVIRSLGEAELAELLDRSKPCTSCGELKLGTEFYVTEGRTRPTLTSRCRSCLKASLASHGRSGREVAPKAREAIFQRDKAICQICFRPIGDEPWQVDHRVPDSLGGLTVPENLQLSHARCNLAKGGRNRVAPAVARVYDAAGERGQLMLI